MDPLRIFTTGGTIDKIYFDAKSEYEVGEPQIGEILRETGVGFPFEITSLMRKDSLDMTDEDRAAISAAVAACAERHVPITHGTDTMTDTATAMQSIGGKTIVLTGALNPARFRGSDAIFNIGGGGGGAPDQPPGIYHGIDWRVIWWLEGGKNPQKKTFSRK